MQKIVLVLLVRLINPDLLDRFTVHLHRSLKIIQNMFERARSDVRVYVYVCTSVHFLAISTDQQKSVQNRSNASYLLKLAINS